MGARLLLVFLLAHSAVDLPDAGGGPRGSAGPDVDHLLRERRFEEALEALEPAALGGDTKAAQRVSLIRQVSAAKLVAALYDTDDRPQKALAALAELKALPGIQTDPVLHLVASRMALDFERGVFDRQDARASRMLSEADRLRVAGEFTEAIALYDQILASTESTAARHLLAARDGKRAAERARAQAATFWPRQIAGTRDAVLSLLTWLVSISAVAMALVLLAAVSRRRTPRPGIALQIVDLTATGELRAASGQQLAHALRSRVTGPSAVASGRPDVDAGEDFDRSGVANLRLEARELDPLESVVAESDPVKVGAVSFTPAQLYRLVRGMFARSHEISVTGTVVDRGAGQRLALEIRRPGQDAVVAQGETAEYPLTDRERMLDEVGDFVTFHLSRWKASPSWQAFRSYRLASRLLVAPHAPDRRRQILDEACKLLQRSLAHDTTNVLARYRLAVTFRKLGRNAEAKTILEKLSTSLHGAGGPKSEFAEVTAANPGFLLTVKYNLAVTLTKLDDLIDNERALEIFGELSSSEDLAGAPQAGAEDAGADREAAAQMGARVRNLALAGKAAALLWRVERGRPDRNAELGERRRAELVAGAEAALVEIARIRATLEGQSADHDVDRHGYNTALSVALNAHGRASYLLNKNPEVAKRALTQALSHNPALACAHINLAQHYRRHKMKTPHWAELAKNHLSVAVELSPDNRKAHFLLGVTYQDPSIIDLARAKEHLRAAGFSPQVHLAMAEVLLREGDAKGARQLLASSVRSLPAPVDRRHFELLELTASLPAERLAPEDLEAAAETEKSLREHTADAGQLEKSRRLMDAIRTNWGRGAGGGQGDAGVGRPSQGTG